MRYACRLFSTGPTPLVRLVLACFDAPRTWPHEVFMDLLAVWSSGADFAKHLPSPILRPAVWLTEFQQGPKEFRTKLCRTVIRLYDGRRMAGDGTAARNESEQVACPDCEGLFPSLAILACHRAAKHGRLNSLRKFVRGSVCEGCSKQFHTYPRLFHHVRSRPRCADYLQRHIEPMSEDTVRALLAASALEEKARDKKALKPPSVQAA